MGKTSIRLLVSASVLAYAVASPAWAQDTSGASASPVDTTIGEVVVTARRKSENLQNVPQTVSAVGGETLAKLAITQFQDVTALVPGLSLGNSSIFNGGNPAPSLRGISFDTGASPSPTVDIYLNEVPTDPRAAYSALYDIGSVEVLRGPQGTLRGRTAPSGAITVTTRQADVNDAGGYFSALDTDHDATNAQAAVNVPIVSDVLGLRVAGLIDQNEGNFVTSVNSAEKPYKNTVSGRATLTFRPTSTFDAALIYQILDQHSKQFYQVEGDGAVGGVVSTAPAGYNGPRIQASDRLGVDDVPSENRLRSHQLTAQANWSVFGHRISYVGGYNEIDAPSHTATDFPNFLPGREDFQNLNTDSSLLTQEIRISSDQGSGIFDYTVGYFYSLSKGKTFGDQLATYLPGAFGAPNVEPNPNTINDTYSLPVLINVNGRSVENSFFGNATVHLGQRTELSGGARYIISKADNTQKIFLGGGVISTQIGVPCALAGLGSTYGGGYCDVPLAANPTPITDASLKNTKHPFVYSLSLSHRFSDTLLAYGTLASSWRRGGVNNLTNAGNDPTLAAYNFLPPEKSNSLEAGVKTSFLERRLRLNIAAFYQKFDGLLFQQANIPYLDYNGVTTTVDTVSINGSAAAVVKGFDVDASFQVTSNWSISGAVSYADGNVDNDTVPCRDGNFDGVADNDTPTVAGFQAAGTALALCKSNRATSREPIWSGTAQSEFRQPVGSLEGYVRGLVSYAARNPRRDDGLVVPAYALVNLYAGVRSAEGAWDVGLFARNLLDKGVRTGRTTDVVNVAGDLQTTFGSSGYRGVSYTPPREVGVQVRYSFGSR